MTGLLLHPVSSWKIISIMILTVTALRLILYKAPKKIHKMLWMIVGIRACLPFYIKSSIGIISSDSVALTETNHPIAQTGPLDRIMVPDIKEAAVAAPGSGLQLETIMIFIWIFGMILFGIYMIFSYIKAKRLVAGATHVEENIYSSENIPSPFIIGYYKPKIYILPRLSSSQKELIVAHERCHLSNKDHILKALGFVLLGIYWPNPLMWLAYFLFCRDIELACDEEVIKTLPFHRRKEYAIALLDSVHGGNTPVCGVAFGENNIKERIVNVMNYRKSGFWIMICAVAACASIVVAFFTVEKSSGKEEYVAYEFETFDGRTIVIDGRNIISQEKAEDVLETAKVPEDAEIIAPGRDFVYLEDSSYFYVEDAVQGLLTIAGKNDVSDNNIASNSEGMAGFEGDDFSFDYKADSFFLYEDEATGDVNLSYYREDVDMAGSNVLTFGVIADTSCEDIIKEKVEALGGNPADAKEAKLNNSIEKAYVYSYLGESAGSELKTMSRYYAIEYKDGVILLDQFRTIDPNEELENTINSEFDRVLQSLSING